MRHSDLFPPCALICLASVRCLIYHPDGVLWVQVIEVLIMQFSAFVFCISCLCSKWRPDMFIFRYCRSLPSPKPRKFRIHIIRRAYFNLYRKTVASYVIDKPSLTLNWDASRCFSFVAFESVSCTVILLGASRPVRRLMICYILKYIRYLKCCFSYIQ